ncbi:hypothetical protein [Acinetobacter modestus]|uniref:hypothetical protein n=1 Tax=Acinetobacter modestus TaxID=1776740 RepID=UPI00320A7226
MGERIYSWRSDECWSDFSRPEQAIQDMQDNGFMVVGNIFLTGTKRPLTPTRFFPDAADVLEHYDNNIYDNCGDYSEGNTGSDQVSEEAQAELTKLLNDWAENNLSLSFYEIDNEQEIELTQEMIDAFLANQPLPLPEFKTMEVIHES